MSHFAWWAFWGAVIVGLPTLLMDSWKSPAHEVGFKIYMIVALVWNVAFSIYKYRCYKQSKRQPKEA